MKTLKKKKYRRNGQIRELNCEKSFLDSADTLYAFITASSADRIPVQPNLAARWR
jgi:hypothetical protein